MNHISITINDNIIIIADVIISNYKLYGETCCFRDLKL